jgi:precorrin-6x reductase
MRVGQQTRDAAAIIKAMGSDKAIVFWSSGAGSGLQHTKKICQKKIAKFFTAIFAAASFSHNILIKR